MQKRSPHYHVGIDLGTTHTVVAFAHFESVRDIQLFHIEQLISPGQTAAKPLLPSVRYHPAENELSASENVYAQSHTDAVFGEAARLLGGKAKGRLVTSAKSWLTHTSVDHNADILPWGSGDDIAKVSPVEASASYLRHIKTVWNHRFPEAILENQDIVITVPASFDEAARALTLEAANRAGLNHIRLLEEPQAVCYDWLNRHSGRVAQALTGIRLLLVCDIGGGTTDLTLIRVDHSQPEPKLTRIAVGDHIMLGGDNIDLALAHLAESRLQPDHTKLSPADLFQLIEQCRLAKERLLAENAPDQTTLTLLGGGSKLIGASRSVVITRDEVKKIALDGFFPMTSLNDLPDKKRSGVVEFGLPYSAEPAVSKHIAAFLAMHKDASREALGHESYVPDALLLNGGLFRSQAITQRIRDVLDSWKSNHLVVLENNHPEYSVAYGAVSYAVARQEKKLKIGGGSARSYFILVDSADNPSKATAIAPIKRGICVLPKNSPEGEEVILHGRQFALRTGEPVRFDLYSFSGDSAVKAGEIVEITDAYHALPPLVSTFDDLGDSASKEAVVVLGVTQTEFGTLNIQCISETEASSASQISASGHIRQRRWNVEFQIRKQHLTELGADQSIMPQVNAALDIIRAVYGPKSKDIDPNAVKNLRPNLEKQLGKSRTDWDSALLRTLFAALWEGQKYRRRTAHHERVWLSLAGFCLRPGFGCVLDDWRVEQLSQIYSQGIQFNNEIQNWSEWWTLWRRIAGGLDADFQYKLYADIAQFINPVSARQPCLAKQVKQKSGEDMIKLAAVLERLPVQNKIQLGEWLLKRLEKAGESPQTWWALGRIGSRTPFHGSSHNVVPAEKAEVWLNQLLKSDWKKHSQAAFAAALIARNSGDRARDIGDETRRSVAEKLRTGKYPQVWFDMVEHYIELAEHEENQFFGEALPPGLKLIHVQN